MNLDKAKAEFDEAIEHLKEDMSQIQTGRATTELVEEIMVTAYETQSPLQNLANIGVADSKTITIQPWDKTILDAISKAISEEELGLSVSSEGDIVRVMMPDLTEERRKDYVKLMKERSESTRQQIRAIRQTYMQDIESQVKEGTLPADNGKRFKEEVEKYVKSANEQVESLRESKEKDLMTM